MTALNVTITPASLPPLRPPPPLASILSISHILMKWHSRHSGKRRNPTPAQVGIGSFSGRSEKVHIGHIPTPSDPVPPPPHLSPSPSPLPSSLYLPPFPSPPLLPLPLPRLLPFLPPPPLLSPSSPRSRLCPLLGALVRFPFFS